MKILLEQIFTVFVMISLIHVACSWILLISVRNNVSVRTEIFGSIKTLFLGPKTIRLRHIFSFTEPAALNASRKSVRLQFLLAKWSGWLGIFLLLSMLVVQIYWMAAIPAAR